MAELSEKLVNKNPLESANDGAVEKKRKRKEIAPFGNYRRYYGYRVGNNVEEDPRFKVLRKEWFEGKDCLDIGCNSGLITINIAKKFHCRTILGIDIDHERIRDAERHLQRLSREETKTTSSSLESNLRDVVSFRSENFVSSCRPLPLKYYDAVVCLSVTKWVHLNWGDEGLMLLFAKMWRLLQPGGILVLEPQPWESYYKNRLTTETTQMNYSKILFKPDQFQDILLDKIGFRTVEHVTSRVSDATVGFDRPVLVFRK